MEEELRQLLREHGWNLFSRTRRGHRYFYAQKWRKGEFYIVPQDKIDSLVKEDVLKKLAAAN